MLFSGYTGDAVSVFVSRAVGMRLIGAQRRTTPARQGGATTPAPTPAPRAPGLKLSMDARLRRLGLRAPVPQRLRQAERGRQAVRDPGGHRREATRTGFGDLSIHEFATDPDQNLAYASYYAGGLRVLSFGDDGHQGAGHYIDDGGSNFWGVEQFTTAGGRAADRGSDRDFGLYIFRYTGPDAPPDRRRDAAAPPTPLPRRRRRRRRRRKDTDEAAAHVALDGEPEPAASCARGTLTIRLRLERGVARAGDAAGPPHPQQRPARQPAAAGPDDAGERRAPTRPGPSRCASAARCASGWPARSRLPARLSVRVTDVAGNVTTRNVSLTFR